MSETEIVVEEYRRARLAERTDGPAAAGDAR
jgi:hypothetical protein